MQKKEKVSLIIEGKKFVSRKDLLSEHSDYFRAMFSGNYRENDQKEIKIDVVDADSMRTILQYVNNGHVDLSNKVLDDLAVSANFLQMTEFMKQIEYTLYSNLSHSNWLQTIAIAEAISSSKLEETAVAFGILSFTAMEPDCIPSIQLLHWYLSHPYLDTYNEFEVFKFGYKWVVEQKLSADAVLVVLGCLDVTALSSDNIRDMLKLLGKFRGTLPKKIVECLLFLNTKHNLNLTTIDELKPKITEKYTEHVFTEVKSLLKLNCKRKLDLVPCVPVCPERTICYVEFIEGELTSSEDSESQQTFTQEFSQHMYQFEEGKGLVKWIEIGPRSLWGWSLSNWGRTKLVVVGGEYRKGSGVFNRQVAVYDTLRKEWDRHGVMLPPCRHAGVTVLGNSLFIAGGVGSFRVVLSTCIVYDLEEHSYRKVADIPDALQNPAICAHEGYVYLSSTNNIFRFEDNNQDGKWHELIVTHIRANYMISYDRHIYLTQYYHHQLYRFKPEDKWKVMQLENISQFENAASAMCNAGTKIIAFSQSMATNDHQFVEEFEQGQTKVIWKDEKRELDIYDAAGCCALLLTSPPRKCQVSTYSNKYLALFPEN